jgi:CRISPR/Cas system-associated endoribonuclease Cas2
MYIPTEYMSRLAKYYHGDAQIAFPRIACDISDNLFVDLIVLVKSYSLKYVQESVFLGSLDAEIEIINKELKPKISITKNTNNTITIDYNGDSEYMIGMKTIDWDDLDWD